MTLNPIALAIPLFFVGMGLELWAARRRGQSVYRLADSISDIGCGLGSQVVALFAATVILQAYTTVYAHRFVALPTWAAWVLAVIGVDFLYYWWHRLSHEVNVMWAGHVVHHHSEDFNLAVALRQSMITQFTGLPFYLPLALLGVPPLVWGTTLALSTLYQFWIHSELIPKLGPFEWIFNTASHHRVHHAINPRYLDKNYAATFIVWDRLFGTYLPETEPPVYGTVTPLCNFDPLFAQVHYWLDLGRRARRMERWRDRLWLWVARPAWTPKGMKEAPEVSRTTFVKYELPLSPLVRGLLLLGLFVASGMLFVLLSWRATLPTPALLGGVALIVAILVAFSLVLRRRTASIGAPSLSSGQRAS